MPVTEEHFAFSAPRAGAIEADIVLDREEDLSRSKIRQLHSAVYVKVFLEIMMPRASCPTSN